MVESNGHDDVRIASIKVGERYRRAMGDITTLAASIRETGLLHPVVVSKDGNLIAGARRLEACRSLGWTWIPARVVDLDDPLRAELDENVVRKDFTPSEIAAIAKVMREREEDAARERQVATQAKPGEQVGAAKFAEPVEDRGEVRDKIAAATGVSREQVRKSEGTAAHYTESVQQLLPNCTTTWYNCTTAVHGGNLAQAGHRSGSRE